jgi:hypothetical protein
MRTLLKITGVVLLTSLVTLALVVALDQYLHGKYDYWLLNYRGYRGDVVGEKPQGEHRVGVFGGSVAMGYGVRNDESIAGHLQQLLDETNGSPFAVINLAATGDHELSVLADNYQKFEYLEIDTVTFLFYDDAVGCRVDATSVRDWLLFINTLMRHHEALASHVMDIAGVGSFADALNAVGEQRKRLIEAFDEALKEPDAVDADRFADVQLSYGVSEPGGLACLTNLLLLQPTLGHVVDPVDGVEQKAPSRRTGNLVFRYFDYWFVLEERAWEEYFAIRYGSVDEGYRIDPLIRWTAEIRTQLRQLAATEDAARPPDTRPYTSTDFFRDVIGQGKRVHVLLYPSKDPGRLAAVKMYLDYRFRENDAVHVADLSPVFLPEDTWDSYFLDGLHFSALGNQAAAQALSNSLNRDARPQ